MTRLAVWLIGISLVCRLVLSAWLPLGTDETYAIAVAREFSWSFFDHPPLAFWMPVAMAEVTGTEHRFVYRILFVLCGTVTAGLIWKIGDELGGKRVADWSLILFLLAPYMAIGGGLFVVPDGPLDMFLALSALALIKVLKREQPAPLSKWLQVGLLLALAMVCKYQATLFPVAILAFLSLTKGKWRLLGQAGPWIAAVIGLLGLTPVIMWNLQTDWASFTFHGNRVGAEFQPDNFARMFVGQAIYLLPTTFAFAILGIWQGFRQSDGTGRLLAWLSFLPIAAFAATYIYGNNTFPHWTMPGWMFAIPLAALWLTRRVGPWAKRIHWGVAIAIWSLLLVIFIHVPTGVLTRGGHIPDWDNTTEIFDYSSLETALSDRDWISPTTTIATLDWIEAGAISTGLAGKYPMRVLGSAPHHFQFMSAAGNREGLLLLAGRGKRVQHQKDQLDELNTFTFHPLGSLYLPRAGRNYVEVIAFEFKENE